MTRIAIAVAGIVLATGCATVTTTPAVAVGSTAPAALSGQLDFDGAREHLPAPLAALPPAQPDSPNVLRYRYAVRVDDTDLSILMLLNPLTLVGCPTGSIAVTADATLDVLAEGESIRRYTARSVARRLRTIYSGDPLSELRTRALRASAGSIAAQLAADPPAPTKLVDATAGNLPANDGGDR